jgi:hypothetical protein
MRVPFGQLLCYDLDMNIAAKLPFPLSDFVVDIPQNQYYDFELGPNSTYPLKGVTYPVDYGNVPGYTAEDGKELDLFVGQHTAGETGCIVVYRGETAPNEHKFYVGLIGQEVQEVLRQLKPVLVAHEEISDVSALLAAIEPYKDKT